MSEQTSPEPVQVKPHTRRRGPRKPKSLYVRVVRSIKKRLGLK